jgi:hypothetical protein
MNFYMEKTKKIHEKEWNVLKNPKGVPRVHLQINMF